MTADAWASLVAAAAADPEVVGLVLTGGRGKGVSTPRSDWDGLLVVADSAVPRWLAAVPDALDVSVLAESDWPSYAEPGTAFSWRGYDLAHLEPAVDHRGGAFRDALEHKGRLPHDVAAQRASDGVGATLNFLYRAAKSARDGDAFATRLDLAEMVGVWLETMFALEDRHRPYNKLLAWEIAHHPLRLVPGDCIDDVRRVLDGDLAAAWRLEALLSAACQAARATAELDGWAGHLADVRP